MKRITQHLFYPQHVRKLCLLLFTASLSACGGDTASEPPPVQTTTSNATSNATTANGCSAENDCPSGECVDGACVECERGSEDCACMNNTSCDAGLRCNTSNICETCPEGAEGCPCEADTCTNDLVCNEGLCALAECIPSSEGCPCDNASCDSGLVCGDDSMCRLCSNDIEGCPCEDDACENDLVCDEEICVPCNNGIEGCPCEDGTCSAGLVCDDAAVQCRVAIACVNAPCAVNQLCADESGDDAICLPDCMPGFTWNPDTTACDINEVPVNCAPNAEGSIEAECSALFRACVEAEGGAACGDCNPNTTDNGGVLNACRPLLMCNGIMCADENRACTEATLHTDATCGACLDGFAADGANCIAISNCLNGDPNDITVDCASMNRTCEVVNAIAAQCGGCLPGRRLDDPNDPGSMCRPVLTCADLDCADGCVEGGAMRDAVCGDRPCSENQALRRDTNTCVDCGGLAESCGTSGETGDVWPYTRENSNTCLCETETGHYADVSGTAVARPCDRDGDGWLRLGAKGSITSTDPTIYDNARCTLRTVERFELENVFGQRLALFHCQDGLQTEPCPEGELVPIELYESDRNDDQIRLDNALNASLVPAYTSEGRGRPMKADEVNPLTKACISTLADYNDNRISDFQEYQGSVLDNSVPPELAIFTRLSYFSELHRAFYEPPAGGEGAGVYVIQERSRCASDFPLRYDSLESDYWRECSRNRDIAYHFDPNERDPVGFDFAKWSCDETTGTCPMPGAPTEEAPSTDTVPMHGACSVPLPLPESTPWRGMNHHSQFKCVFVDPSQEINTPDRHLNQRFVNPAELFDGQNGKYQFNTCRIACTESDPDCSQDCDGERCATSSATQGDLANPSIPNITCAPTLQDGSLDGDEIALVGVRYFDRDAENAPDEDYIRGCINEWRPNSSIDAIDAWRRLCPGYLESPRSVVGQGNPDNFGKLICGCGEFYGGVSCSIGCANPLRGGVPENNFSGCFDGYCPAVPDSEGGGRLGAWMCGDFSVTGSVDPAINGPDLTHDSGLRLRGGIAFDPVGNAPMCAGDDCTIGPSIQ